MGEALWTSRLRWRMRGATLWPAFVLAVVVDAVLLELLPISGDDGPGLFAALILAGVANLIVVAVVAPLAGRLYRRRRPEMPTVVTTDRAGTVLLVLGAAFVAALGLAHRPALRAADADLTTQAQLAKSFVIIHGPPEYRARADHLNTWKQGPQLYRTCVRGPDPKRAYCMIIDTSHSPPKLSVDRDQRPNGVAAGTDGAARH
jgi:hypothetical protein